MEIRAVGCRALCLVATHFSCPGHERCHAPGSFPLPAGDYTMAGGRGPVLPLTYLPPLISPPPCPCHAPTLPSPPPQALWLTCSEDILLGRADNGKMGLPEVARGRLGGGRGGWGRLAGWPIYAWLAGDLGWVAGCLPSNTHNI